MTFAMVSLSKHPKSGNWTARKAIPADVREAYRSPYDGDPKWEEKKTWPSTLSKGQAKAELAAWLVPIEERITLLRAQADQTPITLSQRQTRALAGEWYRAKVAQYEDNPGTVEGWMASAEEVDFVSPDEAARPSKGWTLDKLQERFHVDPQGPLELRVRPDSFLIEERDSLMREKGLKVAQASAEALLLEMATLWLQFCRLMERRAQGDYGPDPLVETLPTLETAPSKPKVAVSINALFDEYEATGTAAPATIKKWRSVIRQFVDFLGHDDASLVTVATMYEWVKVLLAKPLTVKSVRDGYMPAVSLILGDAAARGLIPSNPAQGVKVRGPKVAKLRSSGLTDEEAQTILRASLGEHPASLSKGHALARRWVPWVCAYTGARVNEITQLRAQDIFQTDGVWVIRITPEAGSVKNYEARNVPLHSHLIEQGFHKLGRADDPTPLFYNPSAYRGGSDGNPQHKKIGERLAKWVRSLGIEGVAPNHGWRHRLKTQGRRVGIPEGALAAIQGQAVRSVAESYGEWELGTLKAEIEKLPRYEV